MQEGAADAWNWVAKQFNMGVNEAKKKSKEEL